MSAWESRNKKGWISGKKREVSVKKVQHQYGVFFTPAQCPNPQCHSLDLDCYSSTVDLRYYRCRKCGANFKAIVQYQFNLQ
jgi:hypothetical protein